MQGTARDLLAAAIERFEARGIPIVLTVHDEAVAEVPAGSITEADFLAILLEPPAWAAGLPLAGKVWSGAALSRAARGGAGAAVASPTADGHEPDAPDRRAHRESMPPSAARTRRRRTRTERSPTSTTPSPRCSIW